MISIAISELIKYIYFFFYSIKLSVISNLLLHQIYYMHLGIGTYDYILEQKQRSELKKKLKDKSITPFEFGK